MDKKKQDDKQLVQYKPLIPENNLRYFSLGVLIGIAFFTLVYIMVMCDSNETLQVIYIDSNSPALFTTDPKFVSIGLDAIVIAHGFKGFDMRNPKLIAMMKHLGPGYLRVGGNLQERVKFVINNTDTEYNYNYTIEEVNLLPNISFYSRDLIKLYNLANATNFEIFYGLNALQRFKNGSWDWRNAATMIRFANDNKLRLNWELGNEPNSFRHKFNEVVNATQMSKDFLTLRNLLDKYPISSKSKLVGPDTTRPQHNPESQLYLEEFIKSGGTSVTDKITWHQYYLNGHNTSDYDFIDPKVFDLLDYQINRMKEMTKYTGKGLWLGETSSAYGGGAPMLSDRFIGTFLWIDKLGLAAKLGIEVVVRQSIYYNNYALLDDNYDPNPDWWVSILYKAFVGHKVIPFYNVTTAKTRLYVHCSTQRFQNGVTVFGLNVDKYFSNIEIQGLINKNGQEPEYAYEVLLGSPYLNSKLIYCNGVLLKMKPGNNLPFIPSVTRKIKQLRIPPFSIAFWMIPNVKVRACL